MKILRFGFAALLMLVAGAPLAQTIESDPCKNHYILDDDCPQATTPTLTSAPLAAEIEQDPCKNHYILGDDCPTPPSSFRIKQVYSNLDGSIQYIQLVETGGIDGQTHFAGRTLTSTYGGIVRTFTFPADLPDPATAHVPIVLAAAPNDVIFGAHAEAGAKWVQNYRPDFVLPARFLSTEGGTIELTGIDAVSYDSIPTDGVTALYRDAPAARAVLSSKLCQSYPLCTAFTPQSEPVAAIEYEDATGEHFFVTAEGTEIDALDGGRVPGWRRTGESFGVGVDRVSWLGIEWAYGGVPVCRIALPTARHFYSASPDECAAALADLPGAVLESAHAFYATLPDLVSGECGILPGLVDGDWNLLPLYRLWNGKADADHRFTTSLETRAAMIALGWIPEGSGMGVAMCVL